MTGPLAALLLAAAPALPATQAPPPSAVPGAAVVEAGVAELQAAMTKGTLTSRALVEAYLARIAALDPSLRSVLELNPDALAIAGALDAERKAKGARGPLHGIPVLLKDNIATGDKLQTTAGSLALAGVKAPRDATVAARLRAAGAVILGKTNLSEWANIRSTRSSSGWSARGGQARNPYALDRSPCGSSSGTGSAIAASLATVGVGTETDGSIVCPSSAAALVGLKPTVGLVSRAGIIPISRSQDTAGPMARTVADAAALLNALAGVDPADPATAAAAGHLAPDYTRFLGARDLKGVRVGVARAKVFGLSPEADRLAEEAVAALRKLGAEIVDPADIPHYGEYDDDELAVLLTELKAGLAEYLAEWAPGARVKTLADVIAFDEAHAGEELRWFGQELFLQAEARGPLTDPAYLKALERSQRLARAEGLDEVLDRLKLDAILAPTGNPAWTIDLVNGDHFTLGTSTPSAVAGYPAITVPAGQVFGLPVGVTFMGRRWSEGTLLKIASAYEQATRHRRPPRYLQTIDTEPR